MSDTEPTAIVSIVDNKLVHDGMVVGRIAREEWNIPGGGTFTQAPTIVINLGWCREAGVHVRVLDDPEVDHHRDGKVLER